MGGPGWRAEREKSDRRWLPSPSQQPASGPPPHPARLSQPIRGSGGWADRCFAFFPLSRVYYTLSRYSAIRYDHQINCGSSSAADRSQNILSVSRQSHVGSVIFPAVTKCWRKRLIQPVTGARNLPGDRKDLPLATFVYGYSSKAGNLKASDAGACPNSERAARRPLDFVVPDNWPRAAHLSGVKPD